jgi:hypothetical protein
MVQGISNSTCPKIQPTQERRLVSASNTSRAIAEAINGKMFSITGNSQNNQWTPPIIQQPKNGFENLNFGGTSTVLLQQFISNPTTPIAERNTVPKTSSNDQGQMLLIVHPNGASHIPTASPSPSSDVGPSIENEVLPSDIPTAGPTEAPTASPSPSSDGGPIIQDAVLPSDIPTAGPTEAPITSPSPSSDGGPIIQDAVPLETPPTDPTEIPTAAPTESTSKAEISSKDWFSNLPELSTNLKVGIAAIAIAGVSYAAYRYLSPSTPVIKKEELVFDGAERKKSKKVEPLTLSQQIEQSLKSTAISVQSSFQKLFAI